MKKILLTSLVTAGALAFATVSMAKVYKLADADPATHPVNMSFSWLKTQLKSKARMRIKVYPNSVLGSDDQLMQMLQNGTLTFANVSAGVLESFSKEYKVLSLPYLYKNVDQYHRFLNSPIAKKILASSRKDGFIGLAFLDGGSRSFYADKPIRTPKDLKGLKVRVQNSPITIDMIKAMGATPVPLPYGDIYSGLQQGVVDAAENNIPGYYSARHYEVKKVFSENAHTMQPYVFLVSTEIWDKLPKSKQKIIRELAKGVSEQQIKNWASYSVTAKKSLAKGGVKFVKPNVASFKKAVKPVYTKFFKENPSLKQLVLDIQKTK